MSARSLHGRRPRRHGLVVAWLVAASVAGCAVGAADPMRPDAATPGVDAAGRDGGISLVGNRDTDSDGLPDVQEEMLGTDPRSTDTDGDGVSDLGEVLGSGTDPRDPRSTLPESDFFVVLPHGGEAVRRTLTFGTRIDAADIYFLVDTTESMQPAIANLRDSLGEIAVRAAAEIRSVHLGVGHFEDFPGDGHGEPDDVVYGNLVDVGPDVAPVLSAISGLLARGGGDGPEADTEALYQLATGEGGSWTMRNGAAWSLPRRDCPEVPDEVGRRVGYPCFRPGALPIVVHITDSAFHNGPTMYYRYETITPSPHLFADALGALVSIGARYIGVMIDGRGDHQAMEELARGTGAVDVSGRLLRYDAFGGVVGPEIIDGIQALVSRVPQDVEAVRRNVAGNPDDFDATRFVTELTALDGVRDGTVGPAPGVTYDAVSDATFHQLVPGTTVRFAVTFQNTVREGGDVAQIFRAQIVVVGNRVADLSIRNVYVIVPPDGFEIVL